MVKILKEEDREKVLEYLKEEASYNLFIIGDIENYGFESDFQTLWGSFDENNIINGILLKYNESFIPYYKDNNFDPKEFKKIVREWEGFKVLSCKGSIAEKFRDCFESYKEKSTFFCELRSKENLLENCEIIIEKANVEDAKRIYDILLTIEEFDSIRANSVEKIERTIKTKSGRTYYIQNKEKEMINICQTTAENKYSAMIVGVSTRKNYRRKGYMSYCLSKLCSDIIDEGKLCCLFYDNPEAGRVYHKLGFQTIGKWTMIIHQASS